jgi:hypothetical protein
MQTVAEASGRILQHITRLGVERVPLLDSLGRVLAEQVRAPMTLPAWANSAMDGYAVRAVDIDGVTPERPVRLRVLETVAAGGFATQPVAAGSAIRIMTGAPLPEAADTVVRVEDTDGGTETVVVRDARDARRNVRPRGEDFEEGDLLLDVGAALGAARSGFSRPSDDRPATSSADRASPSSAPVTSSSTSTGSTKCSPAARSSRPTATRCRRSCVTPAEFPCTSAWRRTIRDRCGTTSNARSGAIS